MQIEVRIKEDLKVPVCVKYEDIVSSVFVLPGFILPDKAGQNESNQIKIRGDVVSAGRVWHGGALGVVVVQKRWLERIIFESGRIWELEDLLPQSIALDGAVVGPAIDPKKARYSFDHHGKCVRHATLSCCEQVYDALRVGLNPEGFRIYLNDIDADSALAAWLLVFPERVTNDKRGRLENLIREIGRADALGPVLGRPNAMMNLLDHPSNKTQSTDDLERAFSLLEAWWRGEEIRSTSSETKVEAIWIENKQIAGGWVEQGFAGLYHRVYFGVLSPPGPDGTTAYTIGKASEFVDFDVPLFLARCNELEPGWGGGSTIGGAPRNPDGSRSRLSKERVGRILLDVSEHP